MDTKSKTPPAIVVKKKRRTNSDLIAETAHGSTESKMVLTRRVIALETMAVLTAELVKAARDLERNYNVPGPERFKRVVRLRRALDAFEARFGG